VEVSVQFYDPAALFPEKEPPVPWVEPGAGLAVLEKGKISCSCWDQTLDRPSLSLD